MKKAPLYLIEFWDHSQSDPSEPGPIKCMAIGFLISSDKLCYNLCHWLCNNKPLDHNSEYIYILKSTVIKRVRLRGVK